MYLPIMIAASLYSANAVEPPVYTGQLSCQQSGQCDHINLYGLPNWLSVYGDGLGVSSHMCTSPCSDHSFFQEQKAGYGRPYTIHNNGGKAMKGFKFYHYFNAPPSGKFNVKVYHYFHSNRVDRAAMYRDNAIQPKSIKIDTLSAIQYRAVLDYSNVTIPVGGTFPDVGAFYVRTVSTETKNGQKVPVTGWAAEGHELKGFAITNASGKKLLYGPDLNNGDAIEYPTIDGMRRVGALLRWEYCPDYDQYNPHPKKDALMITLDTDDDDDETGVVAGQDKPVGITFPSGFIKFRYCSFDYEELPRARYDYAVLSLDSECPEGSYRFARVHDTENDDNANDFSGPIWPNIVDDEEDVARLEYCFVPKNSSAPPIYPFVNAGMGVFAKYSDSYATYSKIDIDDENDDNENEWIWYDTPESIKTRIKKFMTGSDNTTYYVLQWKDASLNKKSGAKVADAPISAGQPLVAAVPLAPAIKGLNRSAVAVELKSEGNVKVSIVNAKGSVIANIAQENLQAGVHQIKWNSGMVPSGRYIVKVEQNGMVNAKNVILK